MMIFKHSNRKPLAFWAPDSGSRYPRCWLGMVSSRCLILRFKLMELEGERIQHHGLRKMVFFWVVFLRFQLIWEAFGSCPSHFGLSTKWNQVQTKLPSGSVFYRVFFTRNPRKKTLRFDGIILMKFQVW